MNLFLQVLKQEKLPLPEAEYKFHETRKWRFDYAYIAQKIAIETEGAVWVQGRHTRGSGFVKDLEKYNAAAILGWRVLRYTPDQMLNEAINDIKIILEGK